MQLEHSFTVPVPVDDAWRVLLDVERVAPCMPGAAVDQVDGDEIAGSVKVRVGPVSLTYKGTARFAERDDAAHRAVLEGRGRDTRGNGTAAATVTAVLTGDGEQTRVDVTTELTVTGRPAQFGRGMMSDVGDKLIGQFAECLAGKLSGEVGPGEGQVDPGTPPDAPEPSPAPRPAPAPAEPIDLFATAGPAVLRRVVPVVAGLAAVAALVAVVVRRRRRS